VVAIDHTRRVGGASDQCLHRVPLAADAVAVLADHHVEALHVERDTGIEPCAGEVGEREQRRLWRVGGASRHDAAVESGRVDDVAVGPHEDHGGEVLVGVSHRDGARRASGGGGETSRADPCQRRVPGDIDVAGEMGLGLRLVVRVQHVVEREVMPGEPVGEPLPDRDDLRVVRDRSEDERPARCRGAHEPAELARRTSADPFASITRTGEACATTIVALLAHVPDRIKPIRCAPMTPPSRDPHFIVPLRRVIDRNPAAIGEPASSGLPPKGWPRHLDRHL